MFVDFALANLPLSKNTTIIAGEKYTQIGSETENLIQLRGTRKKSYKDNGMGFGQTSGGNSSVTRAGIGTAAIRLTDEAKQRGIQADVLSNPQTQTNQTGFVAGGLANSFNADALKQEVKTQIAVTKTAGQWMPYEVANYAEAQMARYEKAEEIIREIKPLLDKNLRPQDRAKATALVAQAEEIVADKAGNYEAWKEGGDKRVAMHAQVGYRLTGTEEGAKAAAIVAALAPRFAQIKAGLTEEQQKLFELSIGTIIGEKVGGNVGRMAANIDWNNRMLDEKEERAVFREARINANLYGGELTDHIESVRTAATAEVDDTIARYSDQTGAENGYGDHAVSRMRDRDNGLLQASDYERSNPAINARNLHSGGLSYLGIRGNDSRTAVVSRMASMASSLSLLGDKPHSIGVAYGGSYTDYVLDVTATKSLFDDVKQETAADTWNAKKIASSQHYMNSAVHQSYIANDPVRIFKMKEGEKIRQELAPIGDLYVEVVTHLFGVGFVVDAYEVSKGDYLSAIPFAKPVSSLFKQAGKAINNPIVNKDGKNVAKKVEGAHPDNNFGKNNPNYSAELNQKINLKQNAVEVRAGLPSKLRGGGNVAVADIQISGLSTKKMSAHSGIKTVKPTHKSNSLVGDGTGNFEATYVKTKDGRDNFAKNDSEYKILDNLADKLGKNTQASGRVVIYTERRACDSCLGVANQFRQRYPNIDVKIIHHGNPIYPNKNLINEVRNGR